MFGNLKLFVKNTAATLLLSTLAINVAFAENYEGRGSTPEQARDALARNILTNAQSKIASETQVSEKAFTQNFNHSYKQSSNIILTGIKMTQDEKGEFTATLDRAQFKKDAELTLDRVIAVCDTQLPEAWQPKRKILKQCKEDVDAAVSMAGIIGKEAAITQLSELRATIYSEYDKALIIISSRPEMGYSLDGNTFENGMSHPVNSGEHTIIWQGKGYCKHQETFTINEGEEQSFNPKLDKSPRITFQSRNSDASLTVNGKIATLDEIYTLPECEGTLSYSISNDYDAKTDSITLKPNLNKKVNLRLLTKEGAAKKQQNEMLAERKLKERQMRTAKHSHSFTDLNAWQVLYGYSVANNYENTHRLRLENVKNFKALRYGLGIMYGSSENSKEYEAYAQAAVQLPEFGGYPLNIYGWSFVPYAGAELGLGYHERYNLNSKIKVDKFSRDTLVVRYLVGVDIPISNDLAIKLQTSKQTSMEKSLEFNAGVSMRF